MIWGYIFFSLFVVILLFELADIFLNHGVITKWFFRNIRHPKRYNRTDSGLRYLEMGDASKPLLLLVHGAPGSILRWRKFGIRSELYDHYRVIMVDRAGYAGSRHLGPQHSIADHAEDLFEIIDKEQQKVVVFGHSYGGPIALSLAAHKSDKISKVLVSAGQFYSEYEKIFLISHVIKFRFFRYILPRFLWTVNEEKLSHKKALDDIHHLYEQIPLPVYLFHGKNDWLVTHKNSETLNDQIPHAVFYSLENRGHNLIFTEIDLLHRHILPK